MKFNIFYDRKAVQEYALTWGATKKIYMHTTTENVLIEIYDHAISYDLSWNETKKWEKQNNNAEVIIKYEKKDNSKYLYMEDIDSNDCANFVSQCVHSGGYPYSVDWIMMYSSDPPGPNFLVSLTTKGIKFLHSIS